MAEAVRRAERRSPGVAAARADAERAAAGVRELRRGRLPAFALRSSYVRSDDPVFVFGSLLEQKRFTAADFALPKLNDPAYHSNIQTALDARLPLFAGFELSDRGEMARIDEEKAEAGIRGAAFGVRLAVVDAAIGVLSAREKAARLEARAASVEKEVRAADRLMKRGRVLGSDYYAALAILDGLRARVSSVRAAEGASAGRLAVLAGGGALEGALGKPDYPLPSLNELLASAGGRPDVFESAADRRLAGKAADLASRSLLPRVGAFASWEANTEDFSPAPSRGAFGVRLDLPFGDPAYAARRDGARARARAADEAARARDEAAEIEVRTLERTYRGAVEALVHAGRARTHAAEALKRFRPLYREGRQSLLDIVRAEQGLAEAETGLLEARSHAHLGWARLMAAAGRFGPSELAELDRRLR